MSLLCLNVSRAVHLVLCMQPCCAGVNCFGHHQCRADMLLFLASLTKPIGINVALRRHHLSTNQDSKPTFQP